MRLLCCFFVFLFVSHVSIVFMTNVNLHLVLFPESIVSPSTDFLINNNIIILITSRLNKATWVS